MNSTKLSLFLLGVGALGLARASAGEACGVIAGSPAKFVAVPGLTVAGLTESQAFVAPTVTEGPVTAIVCDRESIVPAKFDYKVIQAGLPFAIRTKKDTLWLEIKNDQLSVSYKEGAMTESEASAVQAWLNSVQPFFQEAAPSKKNQ